MNNFKRFSSIFLYSVFVIFIFLYGENYRVYLRMMVGRTFKPLPLFIFAVVFPIVIGLLLAIPHLLCELSKRGSWRYDWVKFLAIEIPALYVMLLMPFSYTTLLQPLVNLYPSYFRIIMMQSQSLNFVGIAVGYFALSVLHKEAVKNTDTEIMVSDYNGSFHTPAP